MIARTIRGERYVVTGALGAGSQGETLAAVDTWEGRRVAIKCFHIRGARSWKDVELAEREARVLSRLNHPNLPRYIDHFEEDGAFHLVMERIEGESLQALRRRRGPLPQERVARFLLDAAETLRYLHRHTPPIIHRDIKPSNVIARPDGSYCLIDFGSVRDRLKLDGGSTVVGTFGFMAPEQFQGRAAPASDVYAVGATALCLITGQEPEDLPHRGLAIDVEGALGGQVDRRLVGALRSMLEPDPDRRPSSVRAVLRSVGFSAKSCASALKAKPAVNPRVVLPHLQHRGIYRERREGVSALQQLLGITILLAIGVLSVVIFALFQVVLPLLFTLFADFCRRRRVLEIGRAAERRLGSLTEDIQEKILGEYDCQAFFTRRRRMTAARESRSC